MSPLPLANLIRRLTSGSLIELRDDAIVRTNFSSGSCKSRYKDIDTISFCRDCAHSLRNSFLDFYEPGKTTEGSKFTNFGVLMKGDIIKDGVVVSSRPSVGGFSVPDTVDVEKVLRILRDKGIRLTEEKSTESQASHRYP